MAERGASLIELMVVMGLLGMVSAVGVESFVTSLLGHSDQGVTTELAAELRAARSLAISRREPVRVAFVAGQALVLTEPVGAPGTILRQYDHRRSGVVVERLSSGSSVVFYPSGRAATPATITLRNTRLERWQLTVSLTGRVSFQ